MSQNQFSARRLFRYALFIDFIEKRSYPSRAEITDYLERAGVGVSERTFMRTLKSLRETFKLYIEYDEKERGYFIDQSLSPHHQSFKNFLKMAVTADLVNFSLEDPAGLLQYVAFEEQGRLEGIELLNPLLQAIRAKRYVNFAHINYWQETRKPYRVKPLLLKEYFNRWYLVAALAGENEFRTFGLDRIQDLKIENKHFNEQPHKDPRELFRHVIGLTYSRGEPENILIAAQAQHARYLKSLPLHWSQKEVAEKDGEVLFRYHLIPNYEFQQKIFSMNTLVRVLEPQWLRDQYREVVKQMLENYQS